MSKLRHLARARELIECTDVREHCVIFNTGTWVWRLYNFTWIKTAVLVFKDPLCAPVHDVCDVHLKSNRVCACVCVSMCASVMNTCMMFGGLGCVSCSDERPVGRLHWQSKWLHVTALWLSTAECSGRDPDSFVLLCEAAEVADEWILTAQQVAVIYQT